jgi:hypothetical protein
MLHVSIRWMSLMLLSSEATALAAAQTTCECPALGDWLDMHLSSPICKRACLLLCNLQQQKRQQQPRKHQVQRQLWYPSDVKTLAGRPADKSTGPIKQARVYQHAAVKQQDHADHSQAHLSLLSQVCLVAHQDHNCRQEGKGTGTDGECAQQPNHTIAGATSHEGGISDMPTRPQCGTRC